MTEQSKIEMDNVSASIHFSSEAKKHLLSGAAQLGFMFGTVLGYGFTIAIVWLAVVFIIRAVKKNTSLNRSSPLLSTG